MKIQLETEFLLRNQITPTTYAAFLIATTGSVSEYEAFVKEFGEPTIQDLKKFRKIGLLKVPEGKKVKELTIFDVNDNYDNSSDPELWIDEFMEIFPGGVRNKAGYYIRTSKRIVLKKLIKFIKENKEFAKKDMIMQATQNYINKQASSGFQMCKLAPNFIEKDGSSVLAAECQGIKDNKKQTNTESIDLV